MSTISGDVSNTATTWGPRSLRMRQSIAIAIPFAWLVWSSDGPARAAELVDITTAHGSAAEIQTRDQLQRLLGAYDVTPWIYTKAIVIDSGALPHSHPVLTLHTRHLRDDALLLSTFVHEQLHWFLSQRNADTQEAIKELRARFPGAPPQPPEGANGEESTYLHLIDCYLEYRVDQRLLGELAARQVMEFWASDHYTWVYRTVLERTRDIGEIVTKHKLRPPSL